MKESCCLFRPAHFKKDSENRDREGKKHSPELKPFNLLKSRQLSDLITLEASGRGGRVNAQKLTDVTVKERTRNSHGKLKRVTDKRKWASTCDRKTRDSIQHLSMHSGSIGYVQLLYLQSQIFFRILAKKERSTLRYQSKEQWPVSCRIFKIREFFLTISFKSI